MILNNNDIKDKVKKFRPKKRKRGRKKKWSATSQVVLVEREIRTKETLLCSAYVCVENAPFWRNATCTKKERNNKVWYYSKIIIWVKWINNLIGYTREKIAHFWPRKTAEYAVWQWGKNKKHLKKYLECFPSYKYPI